MKKNVVKNIQKPFNTLIEEFNYFSNEIFTNSFEFEKKENKVKELEKISLKDFIDFLIETFIETPQSLEIFITSQTNKDNNQKLG